MTRTFRLLTGFALGIALLASPAPGASADEPLVPTCFDIGPNSPVANDGSSAGARLNTLAPSCVFVTYTLVVLDEPSSGSPFATMSRPGNGSRYVELAAPYVDATPDPFVCVYATTSIGPVELTRAPSSGCVEVSADGAGAQSVTSKPLLSF